MIHDLKCWPEYFQAVKSGIKPFELRKDDRGFAVGDVLHLREFDPDTALYTGDEIDKTVTYVLPTKLFGALGEGAKYVIMGLTPRDWTPCAEGLPIPDLKNTNGSNAVYWVTLNAEGITMNGLFGYLTNPKRGGACWWDVFTNSAIPSCHTVIAWQPLPSPYRADETTGKVKEDDVSQWPEWKQRAALSNYDFKKED